MNDVQDFVKNLDVRTPQVSIQAKIIFVDRTNIEALGLSTTSAPSTPATGRSSTSWCSGTDPTTGDPFDQGNFTDLAARASRRWPTPRRSSPSRPSTWSGPPRIGGFRFTSFLQALQRVDLADVQAEPSITTLDNREAVIKVGEDIPVRIIDFGSQGGAGASQPKATVQFKETGIRLKVTPHVTNNRQVLMQLEAERSDIRLLAAADLGFTIQKQNAKNQLLVNDGETAVIGGLTVTAVTKTRVGIPLLVGSAGHRQAVRLHQQPGAAAGPHHPGHAPDHRRRRRMAGGQAALSASPTTGRASFLGGHGAMGHGLVT